MVDCATTLHLSHNRLDSLEFVVLESHHALIVLEKVTREDSGDNATKSEDKKARNLGDDKEDEEKSRILEQWIDL